MLCLLVSCNHQIQETDVLSTFEDVEKIDCTLEVERIFDDMPYGFVVIDSTLVAFSSSMGQDQLISYNLKDGSRCSSLKLGRGPGESLHVNSIQYFRDSLYISVDPERIFSYAIKDVLHKSNVLPGNSLEGNGMVAEDGSIISFSRNVEDESNSMMYCTSNSTSKIWWGKFPEEKMEYPSGDETKQTAWQGKMILSPDTSKGLFIFYYAVGFDLLDIKTQKVVHRIWCTPRVSIEHIKALGINIVKPAKKFILNFIDASASQDYVCILYTPDGKSKFLLVYDWSGSPVRAYQMDRMAEKIYVSPDNRILYFLSKNEDDVCNLQSIKY